jgi:hypothetical protein
MQPTQPVVMALHTAAQRGDEKETLRLLKEVRLACFHTVTREFLN